VILPVTLSMIMPIAPADFAAAPVWSSSALIPATAGAAALASLVSAAATWLSVCR
jgi:hypothetical protein